VASVDAMPKQVTKKKVTKKATEKKSRPPMQLSVALTGDQRLTQNLIHEVRALAKRYGLETPDI